MRPAAVVDTMSWSRKSDDLLMRASPPKTSGAWRRYSVVEREGGGLTTSLLLTRSAAGWQASLC